MRWYMFRLGRVDAVRVANRAVRARNLGFMNISRGFMVFLGYTAWYGFDVQGRETDRIKHKKDTTKVSEQKNE